MHQSRPQLQMESIKSPSQVDKLLSHTNAKIKTLNELSVKKLEMFLSSGVFFSRVIDQINQGVARTECKQESKITNKIAQADALLHPDDTLSLSSSRLVSANPSITHLVQNEP